MNKIEEFVYSLNVMSRLEDNPRCYIISIMKEDDRDLDQMLYNVIPSLKYTAYKYWIFIRKIDDKIRLYLYIDGKYDDYKETNVMYEEVFVTEDEEEIIEKIKEIIIDLQKTENMI